MGTTTTYREAMRDALHDAMNRDDRVFLMGEDVGAYGGCFAVSLGLFEEFGPERIRDTPLSESAFVGAGIGAALLHAKLRPVVSTPKGLRELSGRPVLGSVTLLLGPMGLRAQRAATLSLAAGVGSLMLAQLGWLAWVATQARI